MIRRFPIPNASSIQRLVLIALRSEPVAEFLDRASATVRVSTDVVPVGSGWGEMHFGEGKYGGAEQVIVTTTDGNKRALSSVLQNVFDAWMSLLGETLPPIGQY